MTIRDLELSLKDEFSGKQDKPGKFRAVITDAAGNRTGSNTIWRNEPRREVWFQSWGSGSLGWALCDNIEPLIGLGVIVQFDEFIGRYEVLRDDPTQRDGNANRRSYRVVSDNDLIRGGRFQLWVESEMIQPLATYPGTGLAVSVVAGTYELNGIRTDYPGAENFSISALQPAGPNEHALIGLYLDSDNNLQSIAGTTVATGTAAPEPVWPSNNIIRLAAVDLDDSQTTLDLSADIDDRRVFVTVGTGSVGSGSWPADNQAMINQVPYSTIQDALDAAIDGDTIKIGAGTFTESLTIETPNVSLVGTGPLGSTKITSADFATISVVADNVKLSDLDIECTGTGVLGVGVAMNTASITTRIERCRAVQTGNATVGYGYYVTQGTAHLIDCIGTSDTANLGYGLFVSGGSSVVYVRDGVYDGDDGDIGTGPTCTINMSGPRLENDNLVGINAFGYWAGTATYGPFRVGGGTSPVNLLYNSLTYDLYQKSHIITGIADDTYFADGWNIIHNQPATDPDIGRQIAGATDPFTHYMRIQAAAASTQFGAVQFLYSDDTIVLRDQTVSLSFDAWGSNISNIRAAIIEWGSTADTITSDVVGTWATGNPTLATNWTYASTPSASTAISASRARYKFENITITNTTNNIAVFIWTPDAEATSDWLNIARVQLELGTISTDFVPRTYPDALKIAQTLVNKSYTQGVVPGTASVIGVTERQTRTAIAATTAGTLRFPIQWPVTMRKTPAVTLYDYTAGTANAVTITGGLVRSGCTAETATTNDSSMAAITVDNSSGNAIALDDLIVFHYYAEALL
jgi:hypothetical protein